MILAALRRVLAQRRWRRAIVAALVGLPASTLGALWLGLEHTPAAPAYAGPAPLGSTVAARFAYPEQGTPAVELSSFRPDQGWGWQSRWLHLEATTPGQATPHRVQVIHVIPDPAPVGPAPAVIVTPILGGDREVAWMLATGLARRGVHAAIVLKAESYFDASQPLDRLERVLRTAIVDRRRAIDWLVARDDVDPQRIGAIGVSLGGLATVLLTAAEPRIRAAVVMMAGGDLGDVVVRSDEPRIRRFVRQLDQPAAALREGIRRAVVSDPLALAPHVDARRLYLIQTRFDTTVPADSQDRLWEALGRPRRTVLPTGHYTAAIYLPYVLPAALNDLCERLER